MKDIRELFTDLNRRWERGARLAELGTYDAILMVKPRSTMAWGNKGRVLRELERYDEALETLEHALELDPAYAWAWNEKAATLRQLDRPKDALAALQQATTLDPGERWYWFNQARLLDWLERDEETLDCWRQTVEHFPRSTYALGQLGHKLSRLGRYEEALEVADRILAIDPHDGGTQTVKANLLFRLGRDDEANRFVEQTMGQTKSTRIWQAYIQGKRHVLNKQYEQAITVFNHFLAEKKDHAAGWVGLAGAYIGLRKAEEAVAALDKAHQLDEHILTAGLWNARGDCLFELKRYDAALDSFERASTLAPEQVTYLLNQAHALLALQRYAEAIPVLDQAQQLAPDSATIYGERAIIHYINARFAPAVEDYTHALELTESDVNRAVYFNNRGEAQFALGQYDQALADFQQASASDRLTDHTRAGLAISYHALGQTEEAVTRWRELIDQDANYATAAWVKDHLRWADALVAEAERLLAALNLTT